MLAVRDGDVERIGVLFGRHHRMLFNFFLRLTANRGLSEDLVQEVFFRMLKYRHTFQAGTNFTAWMYQIACNAQIDQARKHRLEIVPDEESAWEDVASEDRDPHERLAHTQEIGVLRRALGRVPEEKREGLVLGRFQELQYGESARILAWEVGRVTGRRVRAHH